LIESYIRDVPDFPKKGILFKDITPLLQSAKGLQTTIAEMAKSVDPKTFDLVCGIESRGFIFGTALAHHLGK
jgi:adenine phosphoribosyltransferase